MAERLLVTGNNRELFSVAGSSYCYLGTQPPQFGILSGPLVEGNTFEILSRDNLNRFVRRQNENLKKKAKKLLSLSGQRKKILSQSIRSKRTYLRGLTAGLRECGQQTGGLPDREDVSDSNNNSPFLETDETSPTDTGNSPPQPCGNGVVNSGELCDGENLGGKSCADFGFSSGTLVCRKDCADFVTSMCSVQSESVSRITHFGITWIFDKPYRLGRFVNGDPYIVGPVTVVAVNPSPTDLSPYAVFEDINIVNDPYNIGRYYFASRQNGDAFSNVKVGDTFTIGSGQDRKFGRVRAAFTYNGKPTLRLESSSGQSLISNSQRLEFRVFVHGSMLDPEVGEAQGYDSRAQGFDFSKMVQFPITIEPHHSLVSAESRMTADDVQTPFGVSQFGRTILLRAAVLTVLDEMVPQTTFRPPYIGRDKPLYDSLSIHWDRIPSLKLPTTFNTYFKADPQKTLAQQYADYFKPVWIMHRIEGQSEEVRPALNQPGYYRPDHITNSEAALLIVSDIPGKEDLVINYTQFGIDSRAAAAIPGVADRCVSKFPVLFAGNVLNLNWSVENSRLKTEMTYYGNGWNGAHALWRPSASDEFNIEEVSPYPLTANGWTWCQEVAGSGTTILKQIAYQRSTHSYTWVGTALAARVMGLKEIWNHNPFFDYIDRYMTESEPYYQELLNFVDTSPCTSMPINALGYQFGMTPGGYYPHDPRTLTEQMWKTYR